MSEWITVAEAMRLLGQCRQSIHNHIQRGFFTEVKSVQREKQPNHVLYYLDRDEVLRCREKLQASLGTRKREMDVAPVISVTDAAYMAGLIDGEGSICVNQTNATSFTLNIGVTNTHLGVLEWCRETFGGSVGPLNYKDKQRAHHTQAYYWRCP